MTIYVIIGSTGEYSDRDEWLVRGFSTEEKASQFTQRANDMSKEIEREMVRQGTYWYDKDKIGERPLDPNFRIDYTGTEYHCEKVEVDE